MNFGCLEASTGELRVSENSSAHAGWVHLMPYLTLKNHVSKHAQLRNVITHNALLLCHTIIIFVTCILPLKLCDDGAICDFDG